MASISNINLNGTSYDVKIDPNKIKTFSYEYTSQSIISGGRAYFNPTNSIPSNSVVLGLLNFNSDTAQSDIMKVMSDGSVEIYNAGDSTITTKPIIAVKILQQ